MGVYDGRYGVMAVGRVGVDGTFIAVGGVRIGGCLCW